MDKRWYILAAILIVLTFVGAGYSQRHTITITPRETESTVSSDDSTAIHSGTATDAPETTADTANTTDPAIRYILNTNTMKFHYPTCTSVKKIKDKNYAETNATREQVLSQGYSPCGNCKP